MDPLVQASLFVRRTLRRAHGMVLACALAAYVTLGGASAPFGPALGAAIAVWLYLVASRLHAKLREPGDAPTLVDFELGALLAVGVDAALLRFDGALGGRLAPSVYVLVAVVSAFARPLAALAVIVWVLGLEAAIRTYVLHETDYDALGLRAAFVLAVAAINFAFVRAEVARIRATATARVEEQLDRMKQDARS